MSGKVEIIGDLFTNMDQVLSDEVLNILAEIGEEAVQVAGRDWRGWKYGPYYPPIQKGTSLGAWAVQLMQPTELGGNEFERGVRVFNDAKIKARPGSYEPVYWGKKSGKTKAYKNNQAGKKYAAFITRSGETKPEWKISQEKIENEVIPDATRRLKKAILEGWTGNKKKVKLRANKQTGGAVRQFSVTTGRFK